MFGILTEMLVIIIIGVNDQQFLESDFDPHFCVKVVMTQVMSCLKLWSSMKKSTCLIFDGDSLVLLWYLLAAQFVQEGCVGEETILILSSSQFIQKLGTVFLGDFITHKRQEGFELSQHHGSIFIFVVQFAQLNVVMIVSSVFRLLDSLLDKGYNLIKLAEFLLNIISLSVFDSGLLGQIHAKGIEDVHEVVHVKFALAMPIVDIADPSNFISIDRHVD